MLGWLEASLWVNPRFRALDGTAVGADVACGAAVASGVAVADDPQANRKITNSKTIALGKCLNNRGLDLEVGTAPSIG